MLVNYSQKGLAYHVNQPFNVIRFWIEKRGLPILASGKINIHEFDHWLTQNLRERRVL